MSSGPSRTGVGSLPGVLTLMALLRAVALALPTMHLWGLNAARFLPPWLRWTPLVISVATLHPAIGRLCLPGFEWLSRGRSLVLSILAVTLGLLIGFPDRVWFVGDYLLRMGIVSEAHGFETMFPQALPLDAIRHFWLPRTLGAWLHVAPTTIERALGVIEGAWLAVLACRFAKRMNAGPAATTAVALVVLFGGYFTLFTGYGKPTIEVCLFTAAAGAFGLELVRDNRSAIPFGLAVAAALAFHRSGWSILPGAALAWILWYRAHGRLGAWKSVPHAIGFAIPLATVAVLLPRVLRLVLGFDVATNFASAEVRRQGGVLTVAFSSQRLLDVANVILLLSPLALAAVGWLSSVRREPARRNEAWLLLGLALSFVPSLLFVYVTQGPFRDWDAFAGAGVATSLLVGWILCETLRDCERMSWLAVPRGAGCDHTNARATSRAQSSGSRDAAHTGVPRRATRTHSGLPNRHARSHRTSEHAAASMDGRRRGLSRGRRRGPVAARPRVLGCVVGTGRQPPRRGAGVPAIDRARLQQCHGLGRALDVGDAARRYARGRAGAGDRGDVRAGWP